jgi:hypothetical protein
MYRLRSPISMTGLSPTSSRTVSFNPAMRAIVTPGITPDLSRTERKEKTDATMVRLGGAWVQTLKAGK